jgi:hypothetical protein
VADAELAAGERVDEAAVTGAVVSQHVFDLDAVALVEGACASQEGGCRSSFLVRQHFGVSEARVVVDGDVDKLPAELAAGAAHTTGVLALTVAAHPVTGAGDPAELLDVDVHQLAWA